MKHITYLLSVFSFFYLNAAVISSAEHTAQIVIPENANAVEKYAANELSEHLKIICNKDIPVVTKADASVTQIRLGRASGVKSSRLPVNAALVIIADDFIDIAGQDGDGDPLDFRVSTGTLFGVYEFLERELDIRWLWPGNSGTLIPVRETLELEPAEYLVDPPMPFVKWHHDIDCRDLWFDRKNADNFIRMRNVWLRRHRFNQVIDLDADGALTDYAVRFPDKKELFQQMPDGKTDLHGLCMSSAELVDIIIRDWQRIGKSPVIDFSSNVFQSRCVCRNCLKADRSRDISRMDRAEKKFASSDHLWYRELGVLSNRYAAFFLSVQKAAGKIDRRSRVLVAVNENFAIPPANVRLNKQVILRFPALSGYPWQKERMTEFKKEWDKWAKTRAGMMLVSDAGVSGHVFPLMCHRQFAECFDFARDNGLGVVEFTSGADAFAVNGVFFYTMAAKTFSGMFKKVSELERDYLSAFGKADGVMRQFVELMSSVSSGKSAVLFAVNAGDIFTPEVVEKGSRLLADAEKIAADDPLVLERLKFIRTGFEDLRLTLVMQQHAAEYQQGGSAEKFLAALTALREFRRKNEYLGYVDIGQVNAMEHQVMPVHLATGENVKTLTSWVEENNETDKTVSSENILNIDSLNPDQKIILSAGHVSENYKFRVNDTSVSGIFDTGEKLFTADISGVLRTGENRIRIIRPAGDPPADPVSVSLRELPALDVAPEKWHLQIDEGRLSGVSNAYPMILDSGTSGSASGRFFCNTPTVRGMVYEVKVRFQLTGQGEFYVSLRSDRENISRHNVSLKSAAGEGPEKEITGRIVAGSENCSIYLNWQGSGKIEIKSVTFQPVSVLAK